MAYWNPKLDSATNPLSMIPGPSHNIVGGIDTLASAGVVDISPKISKKRIETSKKVKSRKLGSRFRFTEMQL